MRYYFIRLLSLSQFYFAIDSLLLYVDPYSILFFITFQLILF